MIDGSVVEGVKAGVRQRVIAVSVMLSLVFGGGAHTLKAQDYRVTLAHPNSPMVTVAEFRPCVARDTTRCGAWINREVNTAIDRSIGDPPGRIERGFSPNGAWALSFAAVAVRITSITMPDSGRHADVKVPSRTPVALSMSPDSRYAFAVYESLVGQPPAVCMIDLETQRVVVTLDAKKPVSGLGLVP